MATSLAEVHFDGGFFYYIDGVVQLEIAPIEAEPCAEGCNGNCIIKTLMPERHLIDIKMTGLLLSEPIF